jgi:outer membrane protein assembly factor BamB
MSGKTSIVLLAASVLGVAAQAADWPQWRGPNADGISGETGLLKDWPAEGPAVAWQVETLGEGYSSVSVVGGRIYTQGNVDGIEKVICLNEADGSVVWAVQPEPVKAAVIQRIAEALQRGDRNGDGQLEEAEAIPQLGWDLNKAEIAEGEDADGTAADRAMRLIAALDADGDGVLSQDEGMPVLREFFRDADREDPNTDAEALADQRTTALMTALDADGNGQLVQDEFRQSWLGMAFWRIDQRAQGQRRGDGVLTTAEILEYLKTQEPGRDGLISAEELQAYYAQAFPNRDGLYSEAELGAYLNQGYRNDQGNGPRGQPTVDGDRVYVEGAKGDVCCLDAATGETIWHVSLAEDFGGQLPYWGFSESVLIVGDLAVVTPGGEGGAVVALDKATGEVRWRSDEIRDVAEYSSPVAAEVGGIAQIVQFAKNGVYGLSRDAGRVLWSYRHQKSENSINITTPIVAEDCVLIASAYGNGAGMARITTDNGAQSAAEAYFVPDLDNHHGGLVKVGDHVYGTGSRGLICLRYQTGEIVWQDGSVGKGSLTVADGMLYVLGERYQMALVEATPDGYREHGRFQIENLGRPSWTHPVVANGRLYLRNQHKLTAYDVAGQ